MIERNELPLPPEEYYWQIEIDVLTDGPVPFLQLINKDGDVVAFTTIEAETDSEIIAKAYGLVQFLSPATMQAWRAESVVIARGLRSRFPGVSVVLADV